MAPPVFNGTRPVFTLELPELTDEEAMRMTIENEANKFIEDNVSMNTKKKTEFWLKKLQEHAQEIGFSQDIKTLSESQAANLMCSYLMSMKRDDGTNYELSSVNNFSSLIGKWLKDNEVGDIEGNAFKTYQEVKKAKLKILKKDKKGNRPNRAEAVTFDEEDKLWENGDFGVHNPLALTRTMWWYSSMLFGLRGRDESRKMKWGDVKIITDENGEDYLQFEERDTKTRTGAQQSGSRAFAPKMFSNKTQPDRCPVMVYKEFEKRRPAAMKEEESPFYLSINHVRKPTDQIWFMKAPMGKNKLGELLKSGCISAGVPGKKTNHSVRKTGTKRALDAGCPPAYVAQLMGHKNVTSLQNYTDADTDVQRAIAASTMTGENFAVSNKRRQCSDEPAATVTCPKGAGVTINIANCTNVYIRE